ncbi:MAG: hypothetical protein JWO78_192 [Micavibrio sp.]|nr:hypothetical protein [Micavibrio sp.]
MTETRIRTSLQRHQAVTPMDEDEIRRKASQLWQQTGTVMVKPDWVINHLDRQHMQNIAEKLFGKRPT